MADNEKYANNIIIEEMYNSVNTLDYKSCWLWNTQVNKEGYGKTSRMVNNRKYGILIHRLSWYLLYGKIPNNMVIDHICHDPASCINGVQCKHRRCYNPYHLKLTTNEANTKRGANTRSNVGVCRNNLHEWIPENIVIWGNKRKACRPCYQATSKRNTKKAGV